MASKNEKPKSVIDKQMLRAFAKGQLDEKTEDQIVALLEERPDLQSKVAAISTDEVLGKMKAHSQIIAARSLSSQIEGSDEVSISDDSSTAPKVDSVDLPSELAALTDYRIIRELGRGGMGVVYLAQHTLTGRKEVLKVLNERLMTNKDARLRFEQEIKCIASLDHEAIVRCYTVRTLPKTIVLAMEYVPGKDLHEFCSTNGSLPIHVACSIAIDACKGLQHAMNAGLVHRDIKPSNLILYKKAGAIKAKILDFGLARLANVDQEEGLTQDGTLLGTLEYIAPEQCLDAKNADIRSDIYSLGCTLYHMLLGHPPFTGTHGELILAHSQKLPPTVNLVRTDVPVELGEVVGKMLAKQPGRRYATPNDAIEALKPFLSRKARKPESLQLSQTGAPDTRGPSAEALRDTSVEVRQKQKAKPSIPTGEISKAIPIAVPKQNNPKASNIAAPQVVTKTAGHRSNRKIWAIGSGLLGILLLSALVIGIIKIRTANGTIVIENLPEDAIVLVDGETVELEWENQQATITAKPGSHQLEFATKDGTTVEGQTVSVARNDRTKIKIKLVPNETRGSIAESKPKDPPRKEATPDRESSNADDDGPAATSSDVAEKNGAETMDEQPEKDAKETSIAMNEELGEDSAVEGDAESRNNGNTDIIGLGALLNSNDTETETIQTSWQKLFDGSQTSFNNNWGECSGGTIEVTSSGLLRLNGSRRKGSPTTLRTNRKFKDFHFVATITNPDDVSKPIAFESIQHRYRIETGGFQSSVNAGSVHYWPMGGGSKGHRDANPYSLKPNEAYVLEVIAFEKSIVTKVNGTRVNEYQCETSFPLSEIKLACRSDTDIAYTEIAIRNLKSKADFDLAVSGKGPPIPKKKTAAQVMKRGTVWVGQEIDADGDVIGPAKVSLLDRKSSTYTLKYETETETRICKARRRKDKISWKAKDDQIEKGDAGNDVQGIIDDTRLNLQFLNEDGDVTGINVALTLRSIGDDKKPRKVSDDLAEFLPGSIWEGVETRNMRNGREDQNKFNLEVLEVNETSWKGKVKISQYVEFTMVGEISRNKISWLGKDIVHQKGKARSDYEGEILGKKITLKFSATTARTNPISTVDGTATLDLKKKGKQLTTQSIPEFRGADKAFVEYSLGLISEHPNAYFYIVPNIVSKPVVRGTTKFYATPPRGKHPEGSPQPIKDLGLHRFNGDVSQKAIDFVLQAFGKHNSKSSR